MRTPTMSSTNGTGAAAELDTLTVAAGAVVAPARVGATVVAAMVLTAGRVVGVGNVVGTVIGRSLPVLVGSAALLPNELASSAREPGAKSRTTNEMPAAIAPSRIE